MKSQHFHNRMVNDLRKKKTITNYCLKGRTINKDELHTTFKGYENKTPSVLGHKTDNH